MALTQALPELNQQIEVYPDLKHSSDVLSVAFSPDGKTVIWGSGDAAVRLWNRATGQELVELVSFHDGEWIAMTPEGYFNASSELAEKRYINVRHHQDDAQITGITDEVRQQFYRPHLLAHLFEQRGL